MQPKFSFATVLAAAALAASIIATERLLEPLPDRHSAPPATASAAFEPVVLDSAGLEPLVLVGAWRLTAAEPRVGGVSALAVDGAGLVAITDAGAVLRLARPIAPRMAIAVADLPSGPGDGRFKWNRDSEALARDPLGRGWWVAFENHDQLWLFDPAFRRALGHVTVAGAPLGENSGIEGIVGDRAGILAFPEAGGSAIRWNGVRWARHRLDRRARLSDSARIGERFVLLLERRLTPAGFRNALALVDTQGEVFRTLWRRPLPVSWRDNLEALAAEPKAGGGYRLWLMSDDDFQPRMRTLLLVVDLPAAAIAPL